MAEHGKALNVFKTNACRRHRVDKFIVHAVCLKETMDRGVLPAAVGEGYFVSSMFATCETGQVTWPVSLVVNLVYGSLGDHSLYGDIDDEKACFHDLNFKYDSRNG